MKSYIGWAREVFVTYGTFGGLFLYSFSTTESQPLGAGISGFLQFPGWFYLALAAMCGLLGFLGPLSTLNRQVHHVTCRIFDWLWIPSIPVRLTLYIILWLGIQRLLPTGIVPFYLWLFTGLVGFLWVSISLQASAYKRILR